MNLLRQVAEGVAGQFGSSCEVVVHDLSQEPERSIVAIVNGHITGRKVGDGASRVVLEQLLSELPDTERRLIVMRYLQDKTQTEVAKVLGVSQVQVSRLEKKVLTRMRQGAIV